jgi:sec-independent protein translocase protein TatA
MARNKEQRPHMFSQIGPMEIILVLVIALIILGPKKLPEAGKSIGKGMREFKDSLAGINKDEDDERELTAVRSDSARERDVA